MCLNASRSHARGADEYLLIVWSAGGKKIVEAYVPIEDIDPPLPWLKQHYICFISKLKLKEPSHSVPDFENYVSQGWSCAIYPPRAAAGPYCSSLDTSTLRDNQTNRRIPLI
jgi:hypothetical protein